MIPPASERSIRPCDMCAMWTTYTCNLGDLVRGCEFALDREFDQQFPCIDHFTFSELKELIDNHNRQEGKRDV